MAFEAVSYPWLIRRAFPETTVIALNCQLRLLADAQRLGIGEYEFPRTLEDVGAALGVTRERVRQMELTAIKKLKAAAVEASKNESKDFVEVS